MIDPRKFDTNFERMKMKVDGEEVVKVLQNGVPIWEETVNEEPEEIEKSEHPEKLIPMVECDKLDCNIVFKETGGIEGDNDELYCSLECLRKVY